MATPQFDSAYNLRLGLLEEVRKFQDATFDSKAKREAALDSLIKGIPGTNARMEAGTEFENWYLREGQHSVSNTINPYLPQNMYDDMAQRAGWDIGVGDRQRYVFAPIKGIGNITGRPDLIYRSSTGIAQKVVDLKTTYIANDEAGYQLAYKEWTQKQRAGTDVTEQAFRRAWGDRVYNEQYKHSLQAKGYGALLGLNPEDTGYNIMVRGWHDEAKEKAFDMGIRYHDPEKETGGRLGVLEQLRNNAAWIAAEAERDKNWAKALNRTTSLDVDRDSIPNVSSIGVPDMRELTGTEPRPIEDYIKQERILHPGITINTNDNRTHYEKGRSRGVSNWERFRRHADIRGVNPFDFADEKSTKAHLQRAWWKIDDATLHGTQRTAALDKKIDHVINQHRESARWDPENAKYHNMIADNLQSKKDTYHNDLDIMGENTNNIPQDTVDRLKEAYRKRDLGYIKGYMDMESLGDVIASAREEAKANKRFDKKQDEQQKQDEADQALSNAVVAQSDAYRRYGNMEAANAIENSYLRGDIKRPKDIERFVNDNAAADRRSEEITQQLYNDQWKAAERQQQQRQALNDTTERQALRFERKRWQPEADALREKLAAGEIQSSMDLEHAINDVTEARRNELRSIKDTNKEMHIVNAAQSGVKRVLGKLGDTEGEWYDWTRWQSARDSGWAGIKGAGSGILPQMFERPLYRAGDAIFSNFLHAENAPVEGKQASIQKGWIPIAANSVGLAASILGLIKGIGLVAGGSAASATGLGAFGGVPMIIAGGAGLAASGLGIVQGITQLKGIKGETEIRTGSYALQGKLNLLNAGVGLFKDFHSLIHRIITYPLKLLGNVIKWGIPIFTGLFAASRKLTERNLSNTERLIGRPKLVLTARDGPMQDEDGEWIRNADGSINQHAGWDKGWQDYTWSRAVDSLAGLSDGDTQRLMEEWERNKQDVWRGVTPDGRAIIAEYLSAGGIHAFEPSDPRYAFQQLDAFIRGVVASGDGVSPREMSFLEDVAGGATIADLLEAVQDASIETNGEIKDLTSLVEKSGSVGALANYWTRLMGSPHRYRTTQTESYLNSQIHGFQQMQMANSWWNFAGRKIEFGITKALEHLNKGEYKQAGEVFLGTVYGALVKVKDTLGGIISAVVGPGSTPGESPWTTLKGKIKDTMGAIIPLMVGMYVDAWIYIAESGYAIVRKLAESIWTSFQELWYKFQRLEVDGDIFRKFFLHMIDPEHNPAVTLGDAFKMRPLVTPTDTGGVQGPVTTHGGFTDYMRSTAQPLPAESEAWFAAQRTKGLIGVPESIAAMTGWVDADAYIENSSELFRYAAFLHAKGRPDNEIRKWMAAVVRRRGSGFISPHVPDSALPEGAPAEGTGKWEDMNERYAQYLENYRDPLTGLPESIDLSAFRDPAVKTIQDLIDIVINGVGKIADKIGDTDWINEMKARLKGSFDEVVAALEKMQGKAASAGELGTSNQYTLRNLQFMQRSFNTATPAEEPK